MTHRKRSVQLHFMATEHDRELIRQKMEQLGISNNVNQVARKITTALRFCCLLLY